ncbi:hypothetical protein R3W88_007033 [Solanum pinnatisectum]|uniref:SHOCT domain-containing protein n=1 Tax=Solanum pinnatisectum TaxID=50273 RepID=A0AAV9KJB9_9SOLN|nr:hypothetical protein R3W88_007033 [Solanum pinnatisectum]
MVALESYVFDVQRFNFVRLIDSLDKGEISSEEFASIVKALQSNRLGAPCLRQPGESPKIRQLPRKSLTGLGCLCNRSWEESQ